MGFLTWENIQSTGVKYRNINRGSTRDLHFDIWLSRTIKIENIVEILIEHDPGDLEGTWMMEPITVESLANAPLLSETSINSL